MEPPTVTNYTFKRTMYENHYSFVMYQMGISSKSIYTHLIELYPKIT